VILTEGLEVVMASLLGKTYVGHATDAVEVFSLRVPYAQKQVDCTAGVVLRLNE
jgi:hypothetical protein